MSSPDLPGGPRTLSLRVAEIVPETEDAVTVVLDAPELAYAPGQFLTLQVPGGHARCYSLSSSPHTGELPRVTVKHVPGGTGSRWVCEQLRAGDTVTTLAPAGTFTPADLDTDLLLAAAGSGITPVLSIAASVLAAGTGRVTLLYANRDERSVILRGALQDLAAAHPGRFTVLHWLESLQGLPAPAALGPLLAPYADRPAYLCGPAPFMDAAEEALRGAGAGAVHRERYFSLSGDVFTAPAPAAPAGTGPVSTAIVSLDGETHEVAWPEDTPLLDALLAAGVDAPFSCREGACAACTCRVVTGDITLIRNEVLDEQDLKEGYTLACQALPRSSRVSVEY
ncbi:2Fe-2S iron-sulfur cluster-binding protein [Streptomyces sp. NPDC050145]|uniref:2Fe-2S iron-sulfur cluster-binding protein n=1 Tax=Streptomyces sp. NPDC050145 TaxID=3365602 RepID=UPI0037A40A23